MLLNTISPSQGSKHSLKRLGRGIGSGLGKTSGRGHKGQKSRSGSGIRRGFEGGQMPLHRRLPKFGFTSRKNIITTEICFTDLAKVKSNFIDLNILKVANVISKKIKFVKIISSGELKRVLTIHGLRISKGARTEIEKNGGIIEE